MFSAECKMYLNVLLSMTLHTTLFKVNLYVVGLYHVYKYTVTV